MLLMVISRSAILSQMSQELGAAEYDKLSETLARYSEVILPDLPNLPDHP